MKYICQICGYIYDEAKENSAFENLGEDWQCPVCKARKSAFAAERTASEAAFSPAEAETEDLEPLSRGQLAAIFSNLARGSEKQYDSANAEHFRTLADYFTERMEETEKPSLQTLAKQLNDDLAQYPKVNAAAKFHQDRGSQRICVWGEKVTRMLAQLVEQYQAEGETMLKDQQVWVCSVCGFVYIGKTAPELCPVCKVPSWKFEKMEGRK